MSQQRWSRPAYKEFAAALESVGGAGHFSHWNLFQDFLEVAFVAISQPVRKMLDGEIDAKRESRYMEVVRRHKNPNGFAQAYAVMVNALEQEQHDFLGNVAGEWEILNEWNGQFFTPKHICDAMVRINFSEDEKPNPEHRLTICEPACGAGAMVLSASAFLKERGFHPLNYWVEAIDVDAKMFQAAYIQLSLCGVPGIVRNANTLSGEQWDAELTLTGALFPLLQDRKAARDAMAIDAQAESSACSVALPPADKRGQFQLELA